MRKKIMTTLCGFISLGAWAQDSLKTTTLKEVIVSATRTEQPILETPRSVTVIGRDVIERSVYNSVGELLSMQSGIYVVGSNQTPGTNQSLFMRGANSNQVVVMVDGMRITDPSSPNAAIDLSELSLTNIERIEIVKGSHSTIYGGAAIGGAINIITRKNQSQGLHGNSAIQAGTFGNGSAAFTENVDLNYSAGKGFYVNGSILQQNVNGLDASIKKESTTSTYTSSDKDNFRKTDGFIKAGLRNATWDAFVSYKKINQRADIDNGAFSDDDNNYLDFKRDLFEYNLGRKISDHWRTTFLGSFSNSTRLNINDSSVIDTNGNYDKSYFKGNYHGRLQTHELQFNYQYEKIKGVLGTGLYYEKMFFDTYFFYNDPSYPFTSKTNYDSINTAVATNYIFGQLNYKADKLNLSLGSRFSHHQLAGNYATFEFNPSYELNNALLYASLSTGFNAPSLYQLYDPTKGFGAYTTRGNKNLEAEKSLSIEAGLKKEFTSGSYFTISAYQTIVKNSIEYIYLWDGTKQISQLGFSDFKGDTYVNIARQQVQGVELDGHFLFGKKVFLNGNISMLKGNVKVSPSDISSEQTGGNHVQLYNFGTFLTSDINNQNLTRRPKVTTFLQLGYNPISPLTLTVNYRYAGWRNDVGYDFTLGPFGALGQTKIASYHLFDVGAILRASKIFSINLKVENLLDVKYTEIAGFRTRGRSVYLKLTARF